MSKAKSKSTTRAVKALAKLPAIIPTDIMETADRALPVHQYVPSGCMGYFIDNKQSEPHLRFGEFAIIDPSDKTPVAGELYLIRFNHPLYNDGYKKIVQIIRKTTGVLGCEDNPFWVGPYVKDQYIPGHGMMRMMEGPFNDEHLRSKLIGRVVGVMELANTKRLDREDNWS